MNWEASELMACHVGYYLRYGAGEGRYKFKVRGCDSRYVSTQPMSVGCSFTCKAVSLNIATHCRQSASIGSGTTLLSPRCLPRLIAAFSKLILSSLLITTCHAAGGWCSSTVACYYRSKGMLGSSTNWTTHPTTQDNM